MAGLALSATLPTMAFSHKKYTPSASVTMNQKTDKNGNTKSSMAIVAYSDTADVDTADVDTADVDNIADDAFGQGGNSPWAYLGDIMESAFMPIAIIFIMFFLAPVIIIGLIVYLIIKSRRQKIELAEMAIRNGQPIPQDLIRQAAPKDEGLWAKGLKKIFLGVGLVVLFAFMHSSTLIGVGFLVMIYGCGQAFIAYTAKKRKKEEEILNAFGTEDIKDADDNKPADVAEEK